MSENHPQVPQDVVRSESISGNQPTAPPGSTGDERRGDCVGIDPDR